MFGFGLEISYLGIIVLLILSSFGLPVPEEIPIVAAGAASAYDQLSPWWAYACCLGGAIAGDCIVYLIGYRLGVSWLRNHPLMARVLHADREAQAEQMFRRHGMKVLFFGRFLVGIRGTMYLAAGILKIPFRRFFVIDCISATVVTALFFSLSYMYAPQVERLWKWIREGEITFTGIVLTLVAIIALYYFWRRHRRKPLESEADREPNERFAPRESRAARIAAVEELEVEAAGAGR
jgi:membrane protein DedA with SNARE-associated domain